MVPDTNIVSPLNLKDQEIETFSEQILSHEFKVQVDSQTKCYREEQNDLFEAKCWTGESSADEDIAKKEVDMHYDEEKYSAMETEREVENDDMQSVNRSQLLFTKVSSTNMLDVDTASSIIPAETLYEETKISHQTCNLQHNNPGEFPTELDMQSKEGDCSEQMVEKVVKFSDVETEFVEEENNDIKEEINAGSTESFTKEDIVREDDEKAGMTTFMNELEMPSVITYTQDYAFTDQASMVVEEHGIESPDEKRTSPVHAYATSDSMELIHETQVTVDMEIYNPIAASLLHSDQLVIACTNPSTSVLELSPQPQSKDLGQAKVTGQRRKMGSTRKGNRNYKFGGIYEDEPEHRVQIGEGVNDEQEVPVETSIKEDGDKEDQTSLVDCAPSQSSENESFILQGKHLGFDTIRQNEDYSKNDEHQHFEAAIQSKPTDISSSKEAELSQNIIDDQSSSNFIIKDTQEGSHAEDIGQDELTGVQSASLINEHEHVTEDDKVATVQVDSQTKCYREEQNDLSEAICWTGKSSADEDIAKKEVDMHYNEEKYSAMGTEKEVENDDMQSVNCSQLLFTKVSSTSILDFVTESTLSPAETLYEETEISRQTCNLQHNNPGEFPTELDIQSKEGDCSEQMVEKVVKFSDIETELVEEENNDIKEEINTGSTESFTKEDIVRENDEKAGMTTFMNELEMPSVITYTQDYAFTDQASMVVEEHGIESPDKGGTSPYPTSNLMELISETKVKLDMPVYNPVAVPDQKQNMYEECQVYPTNTESEAEQFKGTFPIVYIEESRMVQDDSVAEIVGFSPSQKNEVDSSQKILTGHNSGGDQKIMKETVQVQNIEESTPASEDETLSFTAETCYPQSSESLSIKEFEAEKMDENVIKAVVVNENTNTSQEHNETSQYISTELVNTNQECGVLDRQDEETVIVENICGRVDNSHVELSDVAEHLVDTDVLKMQSRADVAVRNEEATWEGDKHGQPIPRKMGSIRRTLGGKKEEKDQEKDMYEEEKDMDFTERAPLFGPENGVIEKKKNDKKEEINAGPAEHFTTEAEYTQEYMYSEISSQAFSSSQTTIKPSSTENSDFQEEEEKSIENVEDRNVEIDTQTPKKKKFGSTRKPHGRHQPPAERKEREWTDLENAEEIKHPIIIQAATLNLLTEQSTMSEVTPNIHDSTVTTEQIQINTTEVETGTGGIDAPPVILSVEVDQINTVVSDEVSNAEGLTDIIEQKEQSGVHEEKELEVIHLDQQEMAPVITKIQDDVLIEHLSLADKAHCTESPDNECAYEVNVDYTCGPLELIPGTQILADMQMNRENIHTVVSDQDQNITQEQLENPTNRESEPEQLASISPLIQIQESKSSQVTAIKESVEFSNSGKRRKTGSTRKRLTWQIPGSDEEDKSEVIKENENIQEKTMEQNSTNTGVIKEENKDTKEDISAGSTENFSQQDITTACSQQYVLCELSTQTTDLGLTTVEYTSPATEHPDFREEDVNVENRNAEIQMQTQTKKKKKFGSTRRPHGKHQLHTEGEEGEWKDLENAEETEHQIITQPATSNLLTESQNTMSEVKPNIHDSTVTTEQLQIITTEEETGTGGIDAPPVILSVEADQINTVVSDEVSNAEGLTDIIGQKEQSGVHEEKDLEVIHLDEQKMAPVITKIQDDVLIEHLSLEDKAHGTDNECTNEVNVLSTCENVENRNAEIHMQTQTKKKKKFGSTRRPHGKHQLHAEGEEGEWKDLENAEETEHQIISQPATSNLLTESQTTMSEVKPNIHDSTVTTEQLQIITTEVETGTGGIDAPPVILSVEADQINTVVSDEMSNAEGLTDIIEQKEQSGVHEKKDSEVIHLDEQKMGPVITNIQDDNLIEHVSLAYKMNIEESPDNECTSEVSVHSTCGPVKLTPETQVLSDMQMHTENIHTVASDLDQNSTNTGVIKEENKDTKEDINSGPTENFTQEDITAACSQQYVLCELSTQTTDLGLTTVEYTSPATEHPDFREEDGNSIENVENRNAEIHMQTQTKKKKKFGSTRRPHGKHQLHTEGEEGEWKDLENAEETEHQIITQPATSNLLTESQTTMSEVKPNIHDSTVTTEQLQIITTEVETGTGGIDAPPVILSVEADQINTVVSDEVSNAEGLTDIIEQKEQSGVHKEKDSEVIHLDEQYMAPVITNIQDDNLIEHVSLAYKMNIEESPDNECTSEVSVHSTCGPVKLTPETQVLSDMQMHTENIHTVASDLDQNSTNTGVIKEENKDTKEDINSGPTENFTQEDITAACSQQYVLCELSTQTTDLGLTTVEYTSPATEHPDFREEDGNSIENVENRNAEIQMQTQTKKKKKFGSTRRPHGKHQLHTEGEEGEWKDLENAEETEHQIITQPATSDLLTESQTTMSEVTPNIHDSTVTTEQLQIITTEEETGTGGIDAPPVILSVEADQINTVVSDEVSNAEGLTDIIGQKEQSGVHEEKDLEVIHLDEQKMAPVITKIQDDVLIEHLSLEDKAHGTDNECTNEVNVLSTCENVENRNAEIHMQTQTKKKKKFGSTRRPHGKHQLHAEGEEGEWKDLENAEETEHQIISQPATSNLLTESQTTMSEVKPNIHDSTVTTEQLQIITTEVETGTGGIDAPPVILSVEADQINTVVSDEVSNAEGLTDIIEQKEQSGVHEKKDSEVIHLDEQKMGPVITNIQDDNLIEHLSLADKAHGTDNECASEGNVLSTCENVENRNEEIHMQTQPKKKKFGSTHKPHGKHQLHTEGEEGEWKDLENIENIEHQIITQPATSDLLTESQNTNTGVIKEENNDTKEDISAGPTENFSQEDITAACSQQYVLCELSTQTTDLGLTTGEYTSPATEHPDFREEDGNSIENVENRNAEIHMQTQTKKKKKFGSTRRPHGKHQLHTEGEEGEWKDLENAEETEHQIITQPATSNLLTESQTTMSEVKPNIHDSTVTTEQLQIITTEEETGTGGIDAPPVILSVEADQINTVVSDEVSNAEGLTDIIEQKEQSGVHKEKDSEVIHLDEQYMAPVITNIQDDNLIEHVSLAYKMNIEESPDNECTSEVSVHSTCGPVKLTPETQVLSDMQMHTENIHTVASDLDQNSTNTGVIKEENKDTKEDINSGPTENFTQEDITAACSQQYVLCELSTQTTDLGLTTVEYTSPATEHPDFREEDGNSIENVENRNAEIQMQTQTKKKKKFGSTRRPHGKHQLHTEGEEGEWKDLENIENIEHQIITQPATSDLLTESQNTNTGVIKEENNDTKEDISAGPTENFTQEDITAACSQQYVLCELSTQTTDLGLTTVEYTSPATEHPDFREEDGNSIENVENRNAEIQMQTQTKKKKKFGSTRRPHGKHQLHTEGEEGEWKDLENAEETEHQIITQPATSDLLTESQTTMSEVKPNIHDSTVTTEQLQIITTEVETGTGGIDAPPVILSVEADQINTVVSDEMSNAEGLTDIGQKEQSGVHEEKNLEVIHLDQQKMAPVITNIQDDVLIEHLSLEDKAHGTDNECTNEVNVLSTCVNVENRNAEIHMQTQTKKKKKFGSTRRPHGKHQLHTEGEEGEWKDLENAEETEHQIITQPATSDLLTESQTTMSEVKPNIHDSTVTTEQLQIITTEVETGTGGIDAPPVILSVEADQINTVVSDEMSNAEGLTDIIEQKEQSGVHEEKNLEVIHLDQQEMAPVITKIQDDVLIEHLSLADKAHGADNEYASEVNVLSTCENVENRNEEIHMQTQTKKKKKFGSTRRPHGKHQLHAEGEEEEWKDLENIEEIQNIDQAASSNLLTELQNAISELSVDTLVPSLRTEQDLGCVENANATQLAYPTHGQMELRPEAQARLDMPLVSEQYHTMFKEPLENQQNKESETEQFETTCPVVHMQELKLAPDDMARQSLGDSHSGRKRKIGSTRRSLRVVKEKENIQEQTTEESPPNSEKDHVQKMAYQLTTKISHQSMQTLSEPLNIIEHESENVDSICENLEEGQSKQEAWQRTTDINPRYAGNKDYLKLVSIEDTVNPESSSCDTKTSIQEYETQTPDKLEQSEGSLLSEIELYLNKSFENTLNTTALNPNPSELSEPTSQNPQIHMEQSSPARRRKMGSSRKVSRNKHSEKISNESRESEQENENLDRNIVQNSDPKRELKTVKETVMAEGTEDMTESSELTPEVQGLCQMNESSTQATEQAFPEGRRKFGTRRTAKASSGLGAFTHGDYESNQENTDIQVTKDDLRVSDPYFISEPESPPISHPDSETRPEIVEVRKAGGKDTNTSIEAGLVSLDSIVKPSTSVVSTGGRQKIDFEQWNEQIPDFGQTIYNIVLVGNSNVGKTSFIKRLQSGQFIRDYSATIGVDTFVHTVTFGSGTVKLYVWDTAGQERYHSITRQVFHKAQGLLLMYDITSPQSFHAVRAWISQIKENAPPDVILMLLGNKSDCETDREVQLQQGENLSNEYDIHFMECSVATGENVSESLKTLAWLLVKQGVRKEEEYTTLQPKPQNKKSGCC
ncbi:uncharacterized protein rab44 [Hemibagrus wyckioides]|nr:uncharacterized protein rab44 [Hemibagrus wyckioides]